MKNVDLLDIVFRVCFMVSVGARRAVPLTIAPVANDLKIVQRHDEKMNIQCPHHSHLFQQCQFMHFVP